MKKSKEQAAHHEAEAAFIKARDVYDKATAPAAAAYYKEVTAPAWGAYDKAQTAYLKVRAAFDKARKAYNH